MHESIGCAASPLLVGQALPFPLPLLVTSTPCRPIIPASIPLTWSLNSWHLKQKRKNPLAILPTPLLLLQHPASGASLSAGTLAVPPLCMTGDAIREAVNYTLLPEGLRTNTLHKWKKQKQNGPCPWGRGKTGVVGVKDWQSRGTASDLSSDCKALRKSLPML